MSQGRRTGPFFLELRELRGTISTYHAAPYRLRKNPFATRAEAAAFHGIPASLGELFSGGRSGLHRLRDGLAAPNRPPQRRRGTGNSRPPREADLENDDPGEEEPDREDDELEGAVE